MEMLSQNKKGNFIPSIILQHLNKNGIDFIQCLPNVKLSTLADVIRYCHDEADKHGIKDVEFEKLIRESLSVGYDDRYFSIDDVYEKSQFLLAFKEIISNLNLANLKTQKVIVVGIGNGYEGKMLYRDVEDISLIDIAPNSLNQAKEVLPQAKAYLEEASDLKSLISENYDVYISLRTYQSTYFDIISSLKEASRVLKPRGVIIISIACGYVDKNGSFIYGLFNPHTSVLEEDRPYFFVNIIKDYFSKHGLEIVGIKEISTEIFIYARKCKQFPSIKLLKQFGT